MVEQRGGRNPLVDAAQEISILGEQADAELDRMRGPKVADRYEDDPRLQVHRPVAADPAKGVEAANAEGSFEAMLRLMGGGAAGPPAMPGIEAAASEGEGR